MIAISLIMVVCVFLPFFLFPIIGVIGKSKLAKKFEQEAKKFNLKIENKESWNLNLIGTDIIQNKLLFVQQRDKDFIVEVIDLNIVKSCNLLPEILQVKNNGKLENRLQRVDIELYMIQHEGKKLLNLYDYEHNYAQDLEMKHAEKWNEIIQKQLVQRYLKKTA